MIGDTLSRIKETLVAWNVGGKIIVVATIACFVYGIFYLLKQMWLMNQKEVENEKENK